jgi:hypothetical protein
MEPKDRGLGRPKKRQKDHCEEEEEQEQDVRKINKLEDIFWY